MAGHSLEDALFSIQQNGFPDESVRILSFCWHQRGTGDGSGAGSQAGPTLHTQPGGQQAAAEQPDLDDGLGLGFGFGFGLGLGFGLGTDRPY